MYTLPNFITLARLLSVPLIVWLVAEGFLQAAFWTFLVSGISDAADGFLARLWRGTSQLGRILDPVADKALLVCTFVALAIVDLAPLWLVILVVSRDALIVGAFVVSALIGDQLEVRPLLVSKVNTGFQVAYVALVLGTVAYQIDISDAVTALTYSVAFTTIVSGGAYLRDWLWRQAEAEKTK